jgi:hypothetical protein
MKSKLAVTPVKEKTEENARAEGGQGRGDGPFLDFPTDGTIAGNLAHCLGNLGEVGPQLLDLGLQRGDIGIRLVSRDDPWLLHLPSFTYSTRP